MSSSLTEAFKANLPLLLFPTENIHKTWSLQAWCNNHYTPEKKVIEWAFAIYAYYQLLILQYDQISKQSLIFLLIFSSVIEILDNAVNSDGTSILILMVAFKECISNSWAVNKGEKKSSFKEIYTT